MRYAIWFVPLALLALAGCEGPPTTAVVTPAPAPTVVQAPAGSVVAPAQTGTVVSTPQGSSVVVRH